MIHHRFTAITTLAALIIWSGACGGPAGGSNLDAGDEPDVWAVLEADAGDTGDDVDEIEPDVTEPDVVEVDPLPTGSACTSHEECAGGACLTGPEWPDGFCTTSGCDADCGAGEACAEQPLGGTFCTLECQSDDECRAGYACDYIVPGTFRDPPVGPRVCMPPRGLPDGEACEDRDDCAGFCMRDWPGGYCSTFGCETSDDCARQGHDNVCLRSGGRFSQCVRACGGDDDCREGYICEDLGDDTSVCIPDPSRPFDPDIFIPGPLGITCGTIPTDGVATLQFDVAPETTSYMVTPMTKDGQPMTPERLITPSGNSMAFILGNSFQAVGAALYASMNPTMIPATETRSSFLEAGTHQYEIATDSEEVCHYVVEETERGTVIDLNVYLVGVPGLTPENASTHSDFQEVLAQFDTIYEQVGIDIGRVRYFELGAEDTARFEVVRSEAEVEELVKRSVPPGDDLDSLLSVNIFFTGRFAMRGAIGISAGLPGPAGLHGTHGSGVVFTAEFMGGEVEDGFGEVASGNEYTGQILAHEVGHFLGLFHTSESNGRSFDPLGDTPECTQISLNCPDIDNLMFPFAGNSHVQLSDEQGFVLGVNPLTRVPGPDEGE